MDVDEEPVTDLRDIDAKFRENISKNWEFEEEHDANITVGYDVYNQTRLADAIAEGQQVIVNFQRSLKMTDAEFKAASRWQCAKPSIMSWLQQLLAFSVDLTLDDLLRYLVVKGAESYYGHTVKTILEDRNGVFDKRFKVLSCDEFSRIARSIRVAHRPHGNYFKHCS